MPSRITPALVEQFDRLWRSLREAIANFSEEKWRRSDLAYLVPASLAMHLIESVEFYVGRVPRNAVNFRGSTIEQTADSIGCYASRLCADAWYEFVLFSSSIS